MAAKALVYENADDTWSWMILNEELDDHGENPEDVPAAGSDVSFHTKEAAAADLQRFGSYPIEYKAQEGKKSAPKK